MNNYQIIIDEEKVKNFISWLPALKENETYYFCLFARTKYAKNIDGSNKFPHIKSDKNQLKRFVSTPDRAIQKIKQLECEIGSYLTKDGEFIPQESLALYVNINPRSQKKATFRLMKRIIDILECQGKNYNIHAESISALQKSKARTFRVDFDIDTKEIDLSLLETVLPQDSYDILETRGGYHVLVDAKSINGKQYKNWYQNIHKLYEVDQSGDQMIPVPGTYQGGFVPKFIKLKEEIVI